MCRPHAKTISITPYAKMTALQGVTNFYIFADFIFYIECVFCDFVNFKEYIIYRVIFYLTAILQSIRIIK